MKLSLLGSRPRLRAIFSLPSESANLRAEALIELARRGFLGAFVYLPCWLAVGGFSGLEAASTIYLQLTSAFVLVLIARIALHWKFRSIVRRSEVLGRYLLCFLILAAGALWGITVVAAMFVADLSIAFQPLVVVCGVLCTAGTLMLSIDPVIRYGMPTVMLVPFMGGLLIRGDSADTTFALLVLVNIVYLVITSKNVHNDYWSGAHSRAQLAAQSALNEHLSLTDALTGLHNRLHAQRRLEDEWRRASRARAPLSLLMVDIDHFKVINDTYGHPFGDECLRHVAEALRAGVARESDFVSRFGGEEFLILLPNTPTGHARKVAERLRTAVQSLTMKHGDSCVTVSCSIGLATMVPSGDGAAFSALVSQADQALYQAKKGGRNRVVCAYREGGDAVASRGSK